MAEYTCSVDVAVSATCSGDDKARVSVPATATVTLAISDRPCHVDASAVVSINATLSDWPLATGRYRR